MNYKEVLNKDTKRFERVNEEINYLIDRYGVETTKQIIRGKINEEDAQPVNQQPQQAQPQQNQQQVAVTMDDVKAFGQVGMQMQQFIQSHQQSPFAAELTEIVNKMKEVAQKMSQAAQNTNQQANQQPQQQTNQPAQPVQQAQAQPQQQAQ